MEVTDIYGYLRAQANELGSRILESYPRLDSRERSCLKPPICCDPDPEVRVVSSAALALEISCCHFCSCQPPPSRLAMSLRRGLTRRPFYGNVTVFWVGAVLGGQQIHRQVSD